MDCISHRVSAVDGLRREEREEGVVLPPREGVGVRDCLPLSDRELAEGIEALIFALSDVSRETLFFSPCPSTLTTHLYLKVRCCLETDPTHHIT